VKLLERARAQRTLMEAMSFFFKTSFDSLDKQQTNTARLLKQYEDETSLNHKIMQEKEESMTSVIGNLTDEVRALRESGERKDKESAARREKKLKKHRKPLRDSFSYEDLKAILKGLRTSPDATSLAMARDRVCITLFYLLGIRVAELKELTLSDIKGYTQLKGIDITVGKSNSPIKQQLVPSEESRNILLRLVSDDIEALISNK